MKTGPIFSKATTWALIAAGVILLAGCPKPVITIETAPVYQETLSEETDSPKMRRRVEPVKVEFARAEEPALPITFDQLNLGAELDVPFRSEMLTEEVKRLEGQRVTLTGVMLDMGAFQPQDNLILLRNKSGKYGRGELFDHLIEVKLRSGTTQKYTSKPLRVAGTLRIEPLTGEDGNTWRIYILEEAVAEIR
jgi:hypothetical protein